MIHYYRRIVAQIKNMIHLKKLMKNFDLRFYLWNRYLINQLRLGNQFI